MKGRFRYQMHRGKEIVMYTTLTATIQLFRVTLAALRFRIKNSGNEHRYSLSTRAEAYVIKCENAHVKYERIWYSRAARTN